MNRRSLITRIPAALLLAILPGRLTRRAEAQEVAIDVSGVQDLVVAYQDLPYLIGLSAPVIERGNTVTYTYTFEPVTPVDELTHITFGRGASQARIVGRTVTVSSPWQVNRWQDGPVVIGGTQTEMGD